MKINLKNVFHLLLLLLLTALLFLCYSCDIQKEAAKTKSDSAFKENIETRTFRKGDTVTYEIPNVIFKDTIIYRKNVQGTTIKTVYDKSGNIENREFKESLKEKESKKTENFDSSFILYIIGGIVILGIFALFLMFLYLKKNTAVITQFLKSKDIS